MLCGGDDTCAGGQQKAPMEYRGPEDSDIFRESKIMKRPFN